MPKPLLIGGVVAGLAAASVALLAVIGKLPGQSTPEGILLNDFHKFLKEVIDPKTKTKLAGNCDNQPKFAEQINDLEKQLEALKERRNEIINANKENSNESGEWIPPVPGSEPLDFDEPTPETEVETEWVPPFPESEPLNLDDPIPNTDDEWIPPVPGSEPLDFDEPTPETEVETEWVPPFPESEPLNLDPTPSINTQYAELKEINELEKKIIAEINNLKSLCDEDEEEIISTSCPDACKKYADCTIYTEGTTKEDQQDAYDSCMEECPKWSDKTKICINKRPIKGIDDCIHLSFCGLAEYNNVK